MFVLVAIVLALAADDPTRTTVTVAAASDLKFALDEIAAAYAKERPEVEVRVTYGSSGNFSSQIQNGAPFDLFLSADIDYPKRLIDAGHAQNDSLFSYAIGRLVVWTPTGGRVNAGESGLQVVADPAVKKVAIANPAHAPYGRAAKAALEKAGLYDKVKDKLVLGENIAQTAQFVQTGGADVGIIALSLAVAPAMKGKGDYTLVPLDQHPALVQGGCVTTKAQDPAAARAFRAYLVGAAARDILARHGFVLPDDGQKG